MGLITKELEIELGARNIKHFENLGYPILKGKLKIGSKLLVKTKDLPNGSHIKVNVECDECGEKLKPIKWLNYLRYVHEEGKYYCKKCASKLFGREKMIRTKLKNGKSFEQWCIENNREDILDRWDYNLNKCKPSEISYGTKKKYYFKCSRGLHKSELKDINSFTSGHKSIMDCKQCDSLAQFGIDNLGEDFLDKYWDYEKNNKLGINPWLISYGSHKYIYIFCQDKDYHGSYNISCKEFTLQKQRCSYCSSNKIHPLDSLGKVLEDKGLLHLWSDKNKKSPYEYPPYANQEVYWKCPEGKHEDYPRKISGSNIANFRCPECDYSKGEEAISNYFINKGFIKIDQDDFNKLKNENKYNKDYYIPQMKYKKLVGLKGGLLSYDFYIPKLNLIIEYDGEFHFRVIKFKNESIKNAKERYNKQQIHDILKSKYALDNGMNLLRIPYWEFDNLEDILNELLKYCR